MEFLSDHALVWFIAGVVLILLELIVPGVFIIFFGVGALITASCTYLFDISVGMQFLIFSVTSVLSLIFLRSYLLKKIYKKKEGEQDPDEEFIGGVGTCINSIAPDTDGKIEFKGTNWTAYSDSSIEEGNKVKIITKDGLRLGVEPV